MVGVKASPYAIRMASVGQHFRANINADDMATWANASYRLLHDNTGSCTNVEDVLPVRCKNFIHLDSAKTGRFIEVPIEVPKVGMAP